LTTLTASHDAIENIEGREVVVVSEAISILLTTAGIQWTYRTKRKRSEKSVSDCLAHHALIEISIASYSQG
jgi:hypothetical protein